jgi:hypothetical protein
MSVIDILYSFVEAFHHNKNHDIVSVIIEKIKIIALVC